LGNRLGRGRQGPKSRDRTDERCLSPFLQHSPITRLLPLSLDPFRCDRSRKADGRRSADSSRYDAYDTEDDEGLQTEAERGQETSKGQKRK
jgi:hypothetical protein